MVFLLLPLYTHILTTSEMGVADAIYAACTVIMYIVSFTISEATMRFAKMEEIGKGKVLMNSLIIWMASCIIMLFFSLLLKQVLFFSPYITLMFLIVVCQDLYMILSQFARGSEQIRIFSEGGVIQTIFLLAGNIILLVYCKLGIKGYLISYVISFIIAGTYIAIRLKINQYLSLGHIDTRLIKMMVKYSIPLIFTGLSWWILNASDKYVILHFMGTSANGIYSTAHKLPTIITAINGFFNSAWQLSAIDEQKSNDNELFYNKVFNYYSAVLYIMAAGIILTCRYILPLLITDEYYEATQYVPILVMSSLFQVYGNFFGGLNIAYQKTGKLIYSAFVAGIVNLGLNILLTPLIGMYGTAIATCIGCIVMVVIRILDIRLNLGIRFQMGRTIVATVFIGIQILLYTINSYMGDLLQIIVIMLLLLLYKDSISNMIKSISREKKYVLHR